MTHSKQQRAVLAGVLAAVLIATGIKALAQGAEPTQPQEKGPAEITVNALAADPTSHLDKPVALVGVVGVVTPGKGFLMVDHREFESCGLSCLREAATKKIPVRWSGQSPKLEEGVRVEGVLSKSAEGLTFTAQGWVKHAG